MKKSLLLLCLLWTSLVSIANDLNEFEIRLKSGNFIPVVTKDIASQLKPQAVENGQKSYYRIIQFYKIPSSQEKEQLSKIGISLLSYIPSKAYVCAVQGIVTPASLEFVKIRSILPIKKEFKLSPKLKQPPLPLWALVNDEIRIIVKYFTSADKSALINALKAKSAKILYQLDETNSLIIQIKTQAFQELVENPLIQWIESISPPNSPDDLGGSGSTRSNTLNTAFHAGRKYDGSGVVVAVCDDGVIGPHIDYEGRLTQHTTDNSGNHGDMTAGIFFGAGNIDPTVQGFAPGAQMNIYRIGNISITGYPHILNGVSYYNTLGTVITSTSYSQGTGGVYTTDTEFVDQQISQYPNLLHLFSAGNSGTFDHGYGAGPGWANISGGAKAGKNIICVGNVLSNDVLHPTSSRGPAADGRIKPDLCAQGAGQYSTDSPNTYQLGAGTSASSPTIAGVVAQLYQAYKSLNGGAEPETGLLKASLMNTAEDLGNPGPDFKYGWGRINGLKSVRIIEENRYLFDSITQAGNKVHSITVPSNVSELRIMTYWTDVAGNPLVSTALVNDINMQVLDTGNNIYDPWILDHTPNASNLDTDAIRGRDSVNNMEQVTLRNPAPGTYTVNIDGYSIPQGPQKYVIVYDFIYDGLEITYPIGGEGFVPGEIESIRWDASEDSAPFTLEYSTDGGNTYNMIASSIPSGERFYDWTVPGTISSDTKIRVSRGSFRSESDSSFAIVGLPQNVSIISVCPDTIEIGWDNLAGVSMFEISMLGNMYMDSIGTSSTNTFKVPGLNPNQEHWFSVASVVAGAKGRRAFAIRQAGGTTNCVLNNDIELVELIFPLSDIILTCRDLSNSNIQMRINNLGLLPASNIQLNYQIDNGTIVSETLAGPIAPGASLEYTFSTQEDFSASGIYTTLAWANWTSDQNKYNDTALTVSEVINGSFVSNYPYSENFNAFSSCPTTTNCGETNCNLSNGWINVNNNSDFDDIDWRTDAGGTSSSNTGPPSDYDLGNAAGKYLYLESSNGCEFQLASLLSPCIDLSGLDCANLEFAYHMYGATTGELHLDVLLEDSIITDVMNPIIGNQGNVWYLKSVNLAPFIGDTINLRFRGITGDGFTSDIALDAISIEGAVQASADFTYSSGGIDSIVFVNNSTGGINSYNWDFGDSTYSTDPNPIHQYTSSGLYEVSLIVSGDCGSDTIVQSILFTATSIAYGFAERVNVFPNPNNGNFTIQLPPQLAHQKVEIKLYDLRGKLVFQTENSNKGEPIVIQALSLSDGIYFLEVASAKFEITQKIVKKQ